MPEDATNKELKWESSNPDVATVEPSGSIGKVPVFTPIISALLPLACPDSSFTSAILGSLLPHLTVAPSGLNLWH